MRGDRQTGELHRADGFSHDAEVRDGAVHLRGVEDVAFDREARDLRIDGGVGRGGALEKPRTLEAGGQISKMAGFQYSKSLSPAVITMAMMQRQRPLR